MKYLIFITFAVMSCDSHIVESIEKTRLSIYYGEQSAMTYFSNRDYVFYELDKEITNIPQWFEIKNDSTYKITHNDFINNSVNSVVFIDFEKFREIIKRRK